MNDKTEVKTTEALEAVSGTRSPLALVPPSAGSTGYQVFQPVEMTKERRDFLKKQFTPLGCTDLELDYFVAFCERTGLDPVLKQAYLVERSANVNGAWVKKFEPMASEQGMAAKADSLPDFRGMRDGLVYENDEFSIDRVTCEIVHKSGHPSKRGKLVGAWAHVIREGRVVPPSYFGFEEKCQLTRDGKPTKFWARDGSGPAQLLKCCRAEQWRQGWPGIFNGQFVEAEMREEIDVTQQSEATVAGERRATTDVLAEKLKGSSPLVEVEPPSAKGSTVEVVPTQVESPKANPGEAPKTMGALHELTADLVRFEIVHDTQKLAADPAYAAQKQGEVNAAKKAKVERDAKRAAGAVSGDTMDRADKAGPAPVDEGPILIFGEHKKKPIRSLDGAQLLEAIAYGESRVGTLEASKADKVRANIDQIKAVMAEREAKLKAESEREPGSDDGEID